MKQYYLNDSSQANGDREVHDEDCGDLPQMQNRIYLGTFRHCAEALNAAHRYYEQVNGCKTCCIECYTQ